MCFEIKTINKFQKNHKYKLLLQQIDQDADSFFEFFSVYNEIKKAIL